MRILLINKNPVVSELLEFATKDTIHTYKQSDNFECENSEFDLRIVDDAFFDNDKYMLHENKSCIILSDKHLINNFTNLDSRTIVLKKPFLPQDILEIIESFSNEPKTSVLDKKEIGKIQQLLHNDVNDAHIDQKTKTDSNAIADNYEMDKKEYIDNVSYVFDKNSKTNERDLTKAILSMKPKKLKKFLKNANITLKIELKDN